MSKLLQQPCETLLQPTEEMEATEAKGRGKKLSQGLSLQLSSSARIL